MPEIVHCSICGAASPNARFARRMEWLRRHRKNKHPKAFRASIRKGIRTRRRR